MKRIHEIIEEVKALRGANVEVFGQPTTLTSDYGKYTIDIIDVLNNLEDYEIPEIIDYWTFEEEDGEDIEVTTDANGLATIKGLAYADDESDVSYWLVETQAPTYKVTEGGQEVEKTYKLLKTPVEVKVGKTTHNTAVVVQNSKEIDLPATGGIGIAIFAVVGIGIMVISRKMNKEQNIQ